MDDEREGGREDRAELDDNLGTLDDVLQFMDEDVPAVRRASELASAAFAEEGRGGPQPPDLSPEDLSSLEGMPLDDSVRMWLREVGRTHLLSLEEEVRLAKRIERGDQDAKAVLTQANLRLVVSIAKRYNPARNVLS